MDLIYNTTTGSQYPITVFFQTIQKKDIVYDPIRIEQYCHNGCRNYGKSGGCPPFAPKLDKILRGTEECVLILGMFDSKYKPQKVKSCTNRAIHWKFQDAVLANCMDKIGRHLQEKCGFNYLGTGYCMGCHGKKCAIKEGEPCRYPNKRTFSMEATGIDVVQTVQNIFQRRFFWYTKGNNNIPYLMKCILVYGADGHVEEDAIWQIFDTGEKKIERI